MNNYANELLFELGSGQMRKVIPMLMNNTNADWKKDRKAVQMKLSQMVHYREKKDGKWRVPGIHTSTYTDENQTTWEYRWVMIKQGEGDATGEKYHAYLLDKQRFEAGKRVFAEESDKVNFVGKNTISLILEIEDDVGVVRLVMADGQESIEYDINEIIVKIFKSNSTDSKLNDYIREKYKNEYNIIFHYLNSFTL